MKSKNISDALGSIDFDMVEDAANGVKKADNGRKVPLKRALIAACFCAFLTALIAVFPAQRNEPGEYEGNSDFPAADTNALIAIDGDETVSSTEEDNGTETKDVISSDTEGVTADSSDESSESSDVHTEEGTTTNTEALNTEPWGELWVDTRERIEINARTPEKAYLWPWNCLEIHEQFLSIEFGDKTFDCRYNDEDGISSSEIGEKLGDAVGIGYDHYEEKIHTIACEVYQIKGVDSDRIAAIKFDGHDGYYVYRSSEYNPPDTLGELIDSLNLTENCPFDEFYYYPTVQESQHYSLTGDAGRAIWSIFEKYASAEILEDYDNPWNRTVIGFSMTSEKLGVNNKGWSVNKEGYLITNVEEYGYYCYIGTEAVEEIRDIALANCVEVSEEDEVQFLCGTVTEIGEDYIKIDDSIMMKDPDDGMEFTVYATNMNIKRYIISGILPVGATVMVRHEGSFADEPTAIRTALSLDEAVITDEGDVLIPE